VTGKSTERSKRAQAHARLRDRHVRLEQAARAADTKAPAEIEELFSQLYYDPEFFIEWALSVSPIEGGTLVPFILNPGQRTVVGKVKELEAAGKPVRIIVLKSRRQGISTLCEALVYWKTSTRENVNGICVAHDKDTAGEIFRMSQTFYDTDRRHQIPGLMPEIAASNERALRFANPDKRTRHVRPGLKSNFLVETAEGKGVGRSLTLQAAHCAEVAYYTSPHVAAGLGIAVTKAPDSLMIWESTANGTGNLFESTWVDAVLGRNDWVPVFLGWHDDPRNVSYVSPEERDHWEWQTKEEQEMAEKFHLTLEQVKWRRIMIASPEMIRPGMHPEDVFRQEYPIDPEEAFVASGSHFFLPEGLKRLKESQKGPRSPAFIGDIQREKLTEDSVKVYPPTVRFTNNRFGSLQMWELPIAGEDYVIGGDVAEGLSHGDNSIAWVFRRSNQRFVARLKTRSLEPDQFGVACAELGWFFNEALVGIEQNGPGIAANMALRRQGYRRMWYERDIVNLDEPMRNFIGWRTTALNRRPMLDTLEMEIRNLGFEMPAADFYDEARTFRLVETGNDGNRHARPQALAGKHDDEIMSVAIALQLHLKGGALRVVRKKEAEKFDALHPKPRDPSKRKHYDPYAF
jgi:hypothetical protein